MGQTNRCYLADVLAVSHRMINKRQNWRCLTSSIHSHFFDASFAASWSHHCHLSYSYQSLPPIIQEPGTVDAPPVQYGVTVVQPPTRPYYARLHPQRDPTSAIWVLEGLPDFWDDTLGTMTARTVRSYRRGCFFHGNNKPALGQKRQVTLITLGTQPPRFSIHQDKRLSSFPPLSTPNIGRLPGTT